MKKFILSGLLLLVFSASGLLAQTNTWGQDYQAALTVAKKTNKPILMNFSGSDWCKWCKKLDAEVFSQDAFKEYAAKNLVLLLIDSPVQKPMDMATVKQNKGLITKYQIQGFPTILILSPAGEVIAMTGYQYGGVEKYVEHLKSLIANTKET
jgi:protein disulfide-isomerase